MLFPAHAGVILMAKDEKTFLGPFPRPRGGDPYYGIYDSVAKCFSPPTRG